MLITNRWKEMLLSLAAGQSMVPLGDNGPRIRQLSAEIWTLRASEAARIAASARARAARIERREGAAS
jgi:hypothetical protein